MLKTSKKFLLPSEILRLVFGNIHSKKDIKQCLLVCKSWRHVVQEYIGQGISIQVEEKNLQDLLDDIHYFGNNVKTIVLNESYSQSNRIKESLIWLDILIRCPNLISIYLYVSSTYRYLKILKCPEAKMKKIQEIHTNNPEFCRPVIKDLYMWMNVRYRATVTTLEIYDLQNDETVRKYGGLIKLISKFPNLTHLKAKSSSRQVQGLDMDLKKLLKAAPQLQELKLYGISKIINNSQDTETTDSIENIRLTKLKLKSNVIDIMAIQYITTYLLKKVSKLSLLVENVKTSKALPEDKARKILKDLETSTIGMTRINLSYRYRGKEFYSNYGKKPCLYDRYYLSEDDDDYYLYDTDYDFSDYCGYTDSDNDHFFSF
ncbi:hypothetical protein BD770DRAFT_462712 [Pilaira anomala]|nr:hypothetical protein BD770DRAFT_462712 [Pilaira anomala]